MRSQLVALAGSVWFIAVATIACGNGPSPASIPSATPGAECARETCGPAPGMPAMACPDGSTGGNTGRCIVQAGGGCGWEIRECPSAGAPAPGGECVRGGCSGTLCSEPGNDMVSTCEWKPEYACYQKAECKRQAGGACGWTKTPELDACVANPPKE